MNYFDRKAVIDNLQELSNRLEEAWQDESMQFTFNFNDDEYARWYESLETAMNEMVNLNDFIKEMN